MRFTYTYRSSDGQRRSAEIEAESRDDAFARVRRELGIKPIKVMVAAEDSASRKGAGTVSPSVARWAILLLAVGLVLAAVGAWLWRTVTQGRPYQVMTAQGPVTCTVATPLPRQTVPGDRRRIEAARETAFRLPAERLLARFAEPGREAAGVPMPRKDGELDFEACLKETIRIASTDFTEAVDLKRIVAGMKHEMRAYLAGGGTVAQYLAELEKRQRLEISYRERAEQRLNEILNGRDGRPPRANPSALKTAYDYWLKANASLKSMGIYELPLPDALHGYQAGMDIND